MKKLFIFFSEFFIFSLLFTVYCVLFPSPTLAQSNILTLNYTVDRSQVPLLYYNDLTYLVQVNGGSSTVIANGLTIPFTPVSGNQIMFTTPANAFTVTVTNPSPSTGVGTIQKAILKDNKAWAWSHGFDDNVNYKQTGIPAFQAKEWRATVYMIGGSISDTRQQDWIVDRPDLINLMNSGWGIGNHTWGHGYASSDPNQTKADILELENYYKTYLRPLTTKPIYRFTSFAAPMFDGGYQPVILDMRNNNQSDILFNESGDAAFKRLDPGATEPPYARFTIFDSDEPLGRDWRMSEYNSNNLEDQDLKSDLQTLINNLNSTHHYWYNSFTHSTDGSPNNQSVMGFIDWLYNSEGPAGLNRVWVAPAEEIYSYLLTRDKSIVSLNGTPQPTPTPTPPPSSVPTPTPTPNPNGPQITIANSSGVGGYKIGIFGSGFGATKGNSTVKIIGTPAQINEWKDTYINATIPNDADTTDDIGTIEITVNNQSNTWPFTRYHIDPSFLTKPQDLENISIVNETTGKEVYYSGETANDWNLPNPTTTLSRNNNNWGGLFIMLGANSTVTVDVGAPISGLAWFSFFGGSNWYTTTEAAANYQIQGSLSMTGPWTTLATVTGNQRRSRTHAITTNNHRYFRLAVTQTNGASYKIMEIRVHQPKPNTIGTFPDSLAIIGDSITAEDFKYLRNDQFFVSMLHTLRNDDTYLMNYALGMSGAKSDKLTLPASDSTSLAAGVQENPDFHYWGLAFGTNDSQDPTNAAAYKTRVNQGIQQLLASGKVPLIARLPDTDESRGGFGNFQNKKTILQSIDDLNAQHHLIPGPDLYTTFHYNVLFQNSSYIDGGGTHHSTSGSVVENQLWAQAIYDSGIYTGVTPPPVPGDTDGDNDVDIFDYNAVVSDFSWTGAPGSIPADLDDDGDVDIFDYNLVVTNFGTGS